MNLISIVMVNHQNYLTKGVLLCDCCQVGQLMDVQDLLDGLFLLDPLFTSGVSYILDSPERSRMC